MADYNVRFTDSLNKGSITVEANSVNTDDTSLQLPGQNLPNYGQIVNENFLHLLENFANIIAPDNPVEGQLWYDTTTGVDQLKIYDGTNWVAAGNIKKALTEPEAAQSVLGDIWVDTSNQQLYLYSGSGWILVGPDYSEGTATGAKIQSYEATDDLIYTVLANFANEKIISIYSADTFTPKVKLPGFPTGYVIKPGVNIPTESSFSGTKAKYYGTAEKAELVVNSTATDTITFDKIVRKDKTNDLAEKLRIKKDAGLSIGENDLLQLSVSGSTAIIRQFSPDGNIDVKVNNNGINTTAIRATPQGRIGIGNLSPQEILDVTGNIKSSGKIIVSSTINSLSSTDGALTVAGGIGVARDVNIGGDVTIEGITTAGTIVPDTTLTRSLGTTVLRYNNVYSQTFTGNLVGSVTGNVSGAAGSAARLNSQTTFKFNNTGDVYQDLTEISTNGFEGVRFDGQGSLTKQWTLRLNPQFIDNQTEVPSVSNATIATDTFLVNRSGILYQITHADIISRIPVNGIGPLVPIGSVMQYAGTGVAPSGWAFCHGQAISTLPGYGVGGGGSGFGVYEPLAAVLAQSGSFAYGQTGLGVPLLPDSRGRFPIGNLTGTYTLDHRVTDGPNNGVGTVDGEQQRIIESNNLPDHAHSLTGDGGEQFFATTAVTGTTSTGSGVSSIVGGGPGSQTTQTGGMVNYLGNPLQTIPPFLTFEFIIYTGVHL
jgi:microcystin-dependent protein